jgi:DNA repair photolyase
MFESYPMRWENLQLQRSQSETSEALPLALPGAVVRTFDTPDFKGITCYEIRAKSIINRVPGESRLPFQWTINPYRGCTHACTYCLSGDTRILMADGRTRELAQLSVGDQIYGTERRGSYRRYVPTTVLAHWSTTKPAYRVTLADGTRLVASGDHRFLTDRGWRYVTGTMNCSGRRPYLTTTNSLLGTGRFAESPKQDDDYRRGYLCGMVRGDANLADREALDRSEEYLAGFGVPTTRAGVEAVTQLIEWPTRVGDSWTRGFLAGIFDAEGSCPQSVLRISNSDDTIIAAIATGLARFGFDHAIEDPGRTNRVRSVRLQGGLRERLRFFHTADPAITRKRTIDGLAVKGDAPLRVASIERLGFALPLYDITTGTGDFVAEGVISHNCFARKTHTYLDLDSGHDFDSRIVVKVNAPELLRKELSAASWRGQPIAMGTNVDPYQRAEGRYKLTRGILTVLGEYANPYSILTKGTLVLRDLDLLTEAARVTDVRVSVSVGFVDQSLWRQVEPGAPSPQARLRVCRTLTDTGIGCGVLMAPILPFLTDDDEHLAATVAAIAEAGADSVTPIVLHLRPGAREWFLGWLSGARPDLLPRYERLYGRGAYAPREYSRAITTRVAELARDYGIGTRRPTESRLTPRPRPDPPPHPDDVQLSLL